VTDSLFLFLSGVFCTVVFVIIIAQSVVIYRACKAVQCQGRISNMQAETIHILQGEITTMRGEIRLLQDAEWGRK